MEIKLSDDIIKCLIELKESKGLSLEGNIVKLIDYTENPKLEKYVKESIKSQKERQRKRLDITKQVQAQNKELTQVSIEIERVNEELKKALDVAECSREEALQDLDILQKKTQFELIGTIVKVALYIIIGVGVCTTSLYIYSMVFDKDTQLIGNTWSNMFGIMLTNAFSIIGTIMGVKYASQSSDKTKSD